MKNILLTTLFALAVAGVSAQDQPEKKTSLFFRYGRIISAEACSSKPKITDPTLTMTRSRNSKYVEIIFQPDQGRSLSLHDFTLKDPSGTEYPCIAVAEGDKPYSGITWNFRDMDAKTCHRMLFAIPSSEGEFTLVFKLFPTKIEEMPFKLKSVTAFSKAGSIPNKGRLILPEPPPPPKPPEEPAAENNKENNPDGTPGGNPAENGAVKENAAPEKK